jgi:hypothetical protein
MPLFLGYNYHIMDQIYCKNFLDNIPNEIIHYILQPLDKEIILIVSLVSSGIRTLIEKYFSSIIRLRVGWLHYSINHGFIDLIKWSNRIDTHRNDQDTRTLIILQYLIKDKSNQIRVPFSVLRLLMIHSASRNGHLEAIKWIHTNGDNWTSFND